MVDLWQALALVIAGGLIGIIPAYFVQRWSATASERAEQRQERRKIREEERQARRELRRERLSTLFKYVDLARDLYAHEFLTESQGRMWEDNLLDLQNLFSKEEWLKSLRRMHPGPSSVDIAILSMSALATAPTPEITKSLRDIMAAQVEGRPRTELANALRLAEELIQRHIAEV